MSMEMETFIFGKRIGTILLKNGIVYFGYGLNGIFSV